MKEYIKKSRKYTTVIYQEKNLGTIDAFLMFGMPISRIAEHQNHSKSTI